MTKDFYIDSIEKIAINKDSLINSLSENKAYLSALGAGAGALGGAYLFSDKEDRGKIKDGIKSFTNRKKDFNNKHKVSKNVLRGGGALAGTALALKSGKPLSKAIADGGIAGTAIGDMIGSTVLPARDLYKKHKDEFGTTPDTKSMVKVIGANALPTAALWGSIYGIKNGAMKKNIAKNMTDGVNNAISGKKELADVFNKYNSNPELINQLGQEALKNEIQGKMTKMIEGGMAVPLAMMPVGMIRKSVASIPGALVTPDDIIKKKKQEIEEKSIR